MKLRYQTLKVLVEEALSGRTEKRAQEMLQASLAAADEYVSSVTSGHRDGAKAEELVTLTTDVVALARWLLARRDPQADEYAVAAMYLKQVSDASSFFQTPAFLGKEGHVEKLRKALAKAKTAAIKTYMKR